MDRLDLSRCRCHRIRSVHGKFRATLRRDDLSIALREQRARMRSGSAAGCSRDADRRLASCMKSCRSRPIRRRTAVPGVLASELLAAHELRRRRRDDREHGESDVEGSPHARIPCRRCGQRSRLARSVLAVAAAETRFEPSSRASVAPLLAARRHLRRQLMAQFNEANSVRDFVRDLVEVDRCPVRSGQRTAASSRRGAARGARQGSADPPQP